jgi:hypothetical protein
LELIAPLVNQAQEVLAVPASVTAKVTVALSIYAFGAFWTFMAAARITRWRDPLDVTLCVLATVFWPAFLLMVGYWLRSGKL